MSHDEIPPVYDDLPAPAVSPGFDDEASDNGLWRVAAVVGVVVGLSGMLASVCWLTAATLQNAAYVRTLGQVELLFMFAASVLFFRERPGALEVTGIVLVGGGIVMLLLA